MGMGTDSVIENCFQLDWLRAKSPIATIHGRWLTPMHLRPVTGDDDCNNASMTVSWGLQECFAPSCRDVSGDHLAMEERLRVGTDEGSAADIV